MPDDDRTMEAQENINAYIKEGLIKKVDKKDIRVQNILLGNSTESLKVAKTLFEGNHSNMWTIVCSYYCMYYIANAVLYKNGYKVGEKISHKVTSDALIVFIKDKLTKTLLADYEEALNEALNLAGVRSDELIKSFDSERIKRGRIQYSTTEHAKRSKAQTSLERAERFIFEMEKLLK
jgi:uncharacterized protein (UPF0332 family)